MYNRVVNAVHPDWIGTLHLSTEDKRVRHAGPDSQGSYSLVEGVLIINWDNFLPDTFFQTGAGAFVHESFRTIDLNAKNKIGISGQILDVKRIVVTLPDAAYDVSIRYGSTDAPTFQQVFLDREYESESLPASANVIVDLGANVGYATVFFGLKYPGAKILAVEPEVENFQALEGNTLALGKRVLKERAAVWREDGAINLHTEDDKGAALGGWGVQVSERLTPASKLTPCWKLASLYEKYGFERVDILKVDIEGAELELFSHEPEQWLPKTGMIIIETHDRFRPGSEQAVRKALAGAFEELPGKGENLFFRRLS